MNLYSSARPSAEKIKEKKNTNKRFQVREASREYNLIRKTNKIKNTFI